MVSKWWIKYFRPKKSSEKNVSEGANNTRSVERAVDILECFSEVNTDLRVTDIAKMLGLSKATVYRILRTLDARGYVEQNPESEKYRLGVQTLRLSKVFLSGLDFRRTALPYMQVVRDALNESVNLFVSNGTSRIVVERLESNEPFQRTLKIGDELPLTKGAAGKIFLAFGEATCPDADNDELETIRQRGYAVSHGERQQGASSVAVPVIDHAGKTIAVLAIAGPTIRFREPALSQYVSVVVANGKAISRALGY